MAVDKTLMKRIVEHVPLGEGFFDEIWDTNGKLRPHYRKLIPLFQEVEVEEFRQWDELAKITFFNQGVTFNVYSDKSKGVERIFPFDLLPRIIPSKEWEIIEKGIIQRNHAINLFLYDLYHDKKIIRDKVVPADLIFSSAFYNREMIGLTPPANVYIHVTGTDIIKHSDGRYYVLEDNLRCPSGVSYVLSNRDIMKKVLHHAFSKYHVKTVTQYPEKLLSTILSVAPKGVDKPNCVVLTPGIYNSAYFEHSFLAQVMGLTLVEGRDLFVDKNFVYMKTIHGPKRVDVIYRRIDDDFLDPLVFRPESVLGIPGIMGAYRAGNVTLINAPGTGVADDKAVYTYVPEIIKYYLDEDPILLNVPTYRCERADELQYVLEHMHELVVKPVDESGGYGVFIGNRKTKAEIEEYKKLILDNPRKYIAQPIMSLSVQSTFIDNDNSYDPRHIDLRAFALMGKDNTYVLEGGLTRVALTKGNLIVNSSQGGGSKDTWVLEHE
ncbi:MAG: circularly permuted type 2 ATP-grasp protein [Cytophagaceae bacterium]|jgi:uncharacterized circularly permuted ATP-grasp superfamily protein|nr:circularly permuted type 2 ATP-grasp protein [Cytophagaceae bacterium]